MKRSNSRRSRATAVVLAVCGLLFAVASAASALWYDNITSAGTLQAGRISFNVGPATGVLNATNHATRVSSYNVGQSEAATLQSTGSISIPIRAVAMSQGNKGMSYTVTAPTFGANTVFGNSTVRVFKVADAASCNVASAPATQPSGPAMQSTPVPATYSNTTTPTTEWWCMTAVYNPPASTTYTNVGTVTATAGGVSVTADDSWTTTVGATPPNPATEPTAPIPFAYQTFRP